MLVMSAVWAVLTMLCIISVGALAAKMGYIDDDMERKLSRLTLHFSVPCLLFINCLNFLSRELMAELGFALFAPALTILLSYAAGMLVGKIFRIPRENYGLFCVMFSMSNIIFIGMPICMMIFGEQALPLIAAYFPFNTLLFWTIGVTGIAADADVKVKPGLATLKNVFSPPLVGAILGAVFALTEISLPGFLTDAMRYVGNITTPVACMLVGCTISHMGKDVLRLSREGSLALLGRFVITPLIAFGICALFGTTVFISQVFVTVAAMPVMSQSMLLARAYGANHKLAAQMIAVTTLLGILYVPLLMFVLERV